MVDRAADGLGQAVTATPTPISAALNAEPVPGRLGGFILLSELGQGGMGSVWRARQESVGREVALKLLDPALARDSAFTARFVREAKALGMLNHPHVVSCIDAGVDQGRFFLALELVPGGDVSRLARRLGGRLPLTDVLSIGLDCARGLEAIHAAGLIHRDIKPANIFLTADPSVGGRAKLGDLGLVRPSAGEPRMTHTGAALGTPAYMAPEQARGEKGIDIRADIYALGATLFELSTGEPPFAGETAYAVVSQVLAGPVPDPRRLNPEISVAMAAVILRAMARAPANRFATPRELREDLERLVAGELPLAFSRSLGGNLATGMLTRTPTPSSSVRETTTVIRKRSRPWLVPGILVAAALIVAALVAINPGGSHGAAAESEFGDAPPAPASPSLAPPAAVPSPAPNPVQHSAFSELTRPGTAAAPSAALPSAAPAATLPAPTSTPSATPPAAMTSPAPASLGGALPQPTSTEPGRAVPASLPAPGGVAPAGGLPAPPPAATATPAPAQGLPPPPAPSHSAPAALDSLPPPATVPAP